MKKFILFIVLGSVMVGCNPTAKSEEAISEVTSPFKEYKIIEPEVVKTLEVGIMNAEIASKSLERTGTSAHVISMIKTGSYATGEIKILGEISPEKLEKMNEKRSEKRKLNGLVSYTCVYEYSYTTNSYMWTSDFKLKYE